MNEKVQSRRELFAAILRYTTLVVLAVTGWAVAAKRRRLVQDGICINCGICEGCRILEQCDLPRALSAKQLVAKIDNERR